MKAPFSSKSLRILSLTLLVAGNAYATVNAPIYINGQWINAKATEAADLGIAGSLFQGATNNMVGELANRFVQDNASALGLNERTALVANESIASETLQTVRLKKLYQGLEVIGGEGLIHSSANRVEFASVDDTNLDSLDVVPAINANEAQSIAFSAYNGRAASTDGAALKVLLVNEGENKVAHLSYQVTVRDVNELASEVHYIDAHTGKVLLVDSNIETVKRRAVLAGAGNDNDFSAISTPGGGINDGAFQLVFNDEGCRPTTAAAPNPTVRPAAPQKPRGILRWEEMVSPVAATNSAPATLATCSRVGRNIVVAAQNAMNNSGTVYDYYLANHGRHSIDNKDMLVKSIVNFGSAWSNAAWVRDKSVMVYGTGDGATLNDFSVALDVAAHELTHGVTSNTAKLQYQGESGALNESYSDVFGKLVAFSAGKSADWKLGKELFKDKVSFVRDMQNPGVASYADLKYKGEECSRFNDFCGVHDNSGPPSRAAVLIANSIGKDKMGKIYYLTLTQLLRPASTMKDAGAQTIAACAKLFGAGSSDCNSVATALKTVGLQ